MKITINWWEPVAAWRWKHGGDEVCGICRVQFEGTCPTCIYPGEGCPLVVGRCQHSFHAHCIERWLQMETSRGLCPMCRQVFRQVPLEQLDARAAARDADAGGLPDEPGTTPNRRPDATQGAAAAS